LISYFYVYQVASHFLFFETFCLALRVDDWRAEMLVLQMCGAHVEERKKEREKASSKDNKDEKDKGKDEPKDKDKDTSESISG
jgi:hypothetical protein